MRFIFGGESLSGYMSRFMARGMFGIAYDSTFTGMLAFLIFAAVMVLAAIGLVRVIKWALFEMPISKKK